MGSWRSSWLPCLAVALAHAGTLWGLDRIDRCPPALPVAAIAVELGAPPVAGTPDAPPSPLPPAPPARSEPPSPPDGRTSGPELPAPAVVAATAPSTPDPGPSQAVSTPSPAPSVSNDGGAIASGPEGANGPEGAADGSLATETDYQSNPSPRYPLASRLLGEEGKVLLRVFVDSTGRTREASVRSSSGFPRLDGAALQAVWEWTFKPAIKAGRNVQAAVLVPIRFSLKGP